MGWPLAIAVGAFGIPFGILAREAGLGPWAPVVMSATTFAGSAQFAAASVLDTGGTLAAAVAAAALLNARYVPIGISVAPALSGRWYRRFLQAQLVVDESWALANRPDGTFDRGVLLSTGLLLYAAWVTGTLLGVVGGGLLPEPETLGLDAAFPALFLSLLAPQIRARRAVVAALLGAAVALALIPFAPAGVPIVAAGAISLMGLRR